MLIMQTNGAYFTPADPSKRFKYKSGDRVSEVKAREAAEQHVAQIRAQREAIAGRELSESELIHGIQNRRDDRSAGERVAAANRRVATRRATKYDNQIEQLESNEVQPPDPRLSPAERSAYWLKHLRDKELNAPEAWQPSPESQSKIDKLQALMAQWKFDPTIPQSQIDDAEFAIRSLSTQHNDPSTSNALYNDVLRSHWDHLEGRKSEYQRMRDALNAQHEEISRRIDAEFRVPNDNPSEPSIPEDEPWDVDMLLRDAYFSQPEGIQAATNDLFLSALDAFNEGNPEPAQALLDQLGTPTA